MNGVNENVPSETHSKAATTTSDQNGGKQIDRNFSYSNLLYFSAQNTFVDPNLIIFTKPRTLTALLLGVSILIYFSFTRDESDTVTNVKLYAFAQNAKRSTSVFCFCFLCCVSGCVCVCARECLTDDASYPVGLQLHVSHFCSIRCFKCLTVPLCDLILRCGALLWVSPFSIFLLLFSFYFRFP
jgi:hypothetical protein